MSNQSGWEWVRFEEERERWESLSESEQDALMQRQETQEQKEGVSNEWWK